MNASASQEITNWVQTISYYAPIVLIPLSFALCMWLGTAKLPRTLMWLSSVTLGYAVIQLALILALSTTYNRPEDMLPTQADVYIGENLSNVNTAIGMILYAMQLVTLGLGFFSLMTHYRRNALWIITSLIGLVMIPFTFYFPAIQLRLNPSQASATTWSHMLIMALLADAAVGMALGYAIYTNRMTMQEKDAAQE